MLKPGDIVRMKPSSTWVKGVTQYLNTPLVVIREQGFCLELALLDGTLLRNQRDGFAWTFGPHDLELDQFMMAVRKRRHAQTR